MRTDFIHLQKITLKAKDLCLKVISFLVESPTLSARLAGKRLEWKGRITEEDISPNIRRKKHGKKCVLASRLLILNWKWRRPHCCTWVPSKRFVTFWVTLLLREYILSIARRGRGSGATFGPQIMFFVSIPKFRVQSNKTGRRRRGAEMRRAIDCRLKWWEQALKTALKRNQMRNSTVQLNVWPRVKVKMNSNKSDRAYLSMVEKRPKPVVIVLVWFYLGRKQHGHSWSLALHLLTSMNHKSKNGVSARSRRLNYGEQ